MHKGLNGRKGPVSWTVAWDQGLRKPALTTVIYMLMLSSLTLMEGPQVRLARGE